MVRYDTSQITRMNDIFRECNSLTTLDISNFKTSSVNDFTYIFAGCKSLTSLNLINFDTSLVTNFEGMFSDCLNLQTLYIDQFNTSLVNNMANMFSNCNSLLSLNLTNFNTSLTPSINNMFYNCNENLTYCIDDKKEYSFSTLLLEYTKDCNYICSNFYNYRFIKDKVQYINNCTNDEKYIFEYNNICYEECPIGTYNNSNDYFCYQYYVYNTN